MPEELKEKYAQIAVLHPRVSAVGPLFKKHGDDYFYFTITMEIPEATKALPFKIRQEYRDRFAEQHHADIVSVFKYLIVKTVEMVRDKVSGDAPAESE